MCEANERDSLDNVTSILSTPMETSSASKICERGEIWVDIQQHQK